MIRELRKNDNIMYSLLLADGTTWGFSATNEISPWLKKIAEVMELKLTGLDRIDIPSGPDGSPQRVLSI